jgi:hypothetical protein
MFLWQQWRSCKGVHPCLQCEAYNPNAKLKIYPKEYVEEYVKQHNCRLLEPYQIGKPIKYICSCGSIRTKKFDGFRIQPNCNKCKSYRSEKNTNPTYYKLKRKYGYKCRGILKRYLQYIGEHKTNHTHILLGYTHKDLQNHITNHPNYQGEKDLHIDHIFPFKAFFDYGIYDIKLTNSLDNLQPLTAKENLQKSAKYDKVLFENWLTNKGIKW